MGPCQLVHFQCRFPILSGISALKFGFQALSRIPGGVRSISRHTESLALYARSQLSALTHHNGARAVVLYHDQDQQHGGIVNFNLLSPANKVIGFSSLSVVCRLNNVVLRWAEHNPPQ